MAVPVVLLVFNRPGTTRLVLDALRAARPPLLYAIADGPRPGHPTDAATCAEVRALVQDPGWPCEVRPIFAPENLGCRRRVTSGLDEVFAREERAIVLEDDCVPAPDFIPFCEYILARYARDPRVWSVTGANFEFGRLGPGSYRFSRLFECWGWGTWRRAWTQRDDALTAWPRLRDDGALRDLLPDAAAVRYWTRVFDDLHAERIESWALRFLFTALAARGLHAAPPVNLVRNVGFGGGATHTQGPGALLDRVPTGALSWPLSDAAHVAPDEAADRYTQRVFFERRLLARARAGARRLRRELSEGDTTYASATLERVLRRVAAAVTPAGSRAARR